MEKLIKIRKLRGFLKIMFVLRVNKTTNASSGYIVIVSMGFEVGLTGSAYLYLLESSGDLIIG